MCCCGPLDLAARRNRLSLRLMRLAPQVPRVLLIHLVPHLTPMVIVRRTATVGAVRRATLLAEQESVAASSTLHPLRTPLLHQHQDLSQTRTSQSFRIVFPITQPSQLTGDMLALSYKGTSRLH